MCRVSKKDSENRHSKDQCAVEDAPCQKTDVGRTFSWLETSGYCLTWTVSSMRQFAGESPGTVK